MSSYPRLEIDTNKINHNTKTLVKLCERYNINVAGVTKVFCAFPEVVDAMIKGGVKFLADARIENLKKLKDKDIPKILLRLPMISQAEEVVKYSDISLNSELETIKALSDAAIRLNTVHKIVLMIDLGDLREGVWPENALYAAEKIMDYTGVKLVGVGVNLTCYGGIIPKEDNLGKLGEIAENISNKLGINLEIISGGNSSSLDLLINNKMPKEINNLRLGEAIILGRETAYGAPIENTHQDSFKLVAEVIEIKEKPSMPIGEIGMDAFGNKPVFEDKGIRRRAILAVGRQDVDPNSIIPFDDRLEILGASSDHLIVDVTESSEGYKVGDTIDFHIEYGSLLQLSTSNYIKKIIVE